MHVHQHAQESAGERYAGPMLKGVPHGDGALAGLAELRPNEPATTSSRLSLPRSARRWTSSATKGSLDE
jgi:hypothetical protein